MVRELIFILATLVVVTAFLGYYITQPSQVSVWVDDIPPASVETVRQQFASATENKLAMACERSLETFRCEGSYKADNLIELALYQKKLFDITRDGKVNFSSVVEGSFIAKAFD